MLALLRLIVSWDKRLEELKETNIDNNNYLFITKWYFLLYFYHCPHKVNGAQKKGFS